MPAERLALAVLGRRVPGPTVEALPFHRRGAGGSIISLRTFPADQPDLWAFYVEENGRTPIASLVHRLDLLDRLDLRPDPARRSGPSVLVIHGTADRIVPMARHDELVAGLATAEGQCCWNEVGHQPHWTHPVELAELVGDFLADAGPDWA